MDKETYKLAQKIHNDLLDFQDAKKAFAEATTILVPLPGKVKQYLQDCIDHKLHELENEFKQL